MKLVGLAAAASIVVLGGCTSSSDRAAGSAASETASPPASPGAGGCPSPSSLTGGRTIAVDYVDFVRHEGVTFIAADATTVGAVAVPAADVGRVVLTVSCELSQFTATGAVQPPALFDGSSGFLAAGTEVHALHGYAASCRLAALRNGRWTAYLAQRDVNRVSETAPCALTTGG